MMPATSSNITYCVAKEQDADVICALGAFVYVHTYAPSGINPSMAREVGSIFNLENVRSWLADPQHRFLLAFAQSSPGHADREKQRLIGFAQLNVGTIAPDVHQQLVVHGLSEQAANQSIELYRLYVHAHWLGQGIGHGLMQHCYELASEQGAQLLWLTAYVENTRAIEFYKRQGMQKAGRSEYVFEGQAFENVIFAMPIPAKTAQQEGV